MLCNILGRIGIIRMTIAAVLFFMLLASGLSVVIGILLDNDNLIRSVFTASVCAFLIGTPVVYSFFHLIRKLQVSQMELEVTNEQLRIALKDVKELSGLLPICASCKKIRDSKGYWNQLESYIESHSSAQFSHGLCVECAEALYGREDWFKKIKYKAKN